MMLKQTQWPQRNGARCLPFFLASRGTQKGDFRGMTFIFAVPFQAFVVASLVAKENRTVPVVTF